MKKFAIHPGYITSKNDGDRHFISYNQLIKLYGANPNECFEWVKGHADVKLWDDYIHLKPRFDGDYDLPNSLT